MSNNFPKIGFFVALAGVNVIAAKDHERRIEQFKENNPGKDFKIKWQPIAGTFGYPKIELADNEKSDEPEHQNKPGF